MRLLRVPAALLLLAVLCPYTPRAARAAEAPLIISGAVTWQGRVDVREDVLITETGHLTLAPGTEVVVHPSEGTRTDPLFYATETEIVVRGILLAPGGGGSPTTFHGISPGTGWAGIILDGPAASARLEGVDIAGAQTGVTAIDGSLSLLRSTVTGCRTGVALLGGRSADLAGTRLTGNDYGLAAYSGGTTPAGVTVSGNRERDLLDRRPLDGYTLPGWYRLPYRRHPAAGETEYLGDQSINADTSWRGRVVVRGQVTVQAGATLTIEPGTEVAFRRLDTNADGLGESHLLVLGTLRVLGSPENWVLFTSAEADKRPGDWDKVSLIASESPDNLVRWTRFEYGYQAFHNHFSTVTLSGVWFDRNYRGVQFQESSSTAVKGALFTSNRSAMRFRDSTVTLSDILLDGNVTGINYLRCTTDIADSVVTGTLFDPLLGRESATTLRRVVLAANREGARFKGEGSRLVMTDSAIHRNLEDGLSMTDTEAIIRGSHLTANGLDGLSVTEGKVTVAGSSLAGNGRWAVDNNGAAAVEARDVWWGTTDPGALDALVTDRRDDPSLGPVEALPLRAAPPGLLFPGSEPSSPLSGDVLVLGDVAWPAGKPLVLRPGSTVRFVPQTELSPFDPLRDHPFFPGAELIVTGGRAEAAGTPEQPIRFRGPSGQGEAPAGALNLGGVAEARFSWCSSRRMSTALHVRESAGTVEHCRFEGNDVGLRFNTSALVVRDNLFSANGTGIRFHFGSPQITGNSFRGNDTGVFITDDPRSFTLSGNRFEGNRDYALKLGEPVETDVPATGNWWGSSKEEVVPPLVFDRSDAEHLGRVLFRPLLPSPPAEPAVPNDGDVVY